MTTVVGALMVVALLASAFLLGCRAVLNARSSATIDHDLDAGPR